MDQWRCPECGFENSMSERRCPGCGYARVTALQLEGEIAGVLLRIAITTDVGKHTVRPLGDDSMFFDALQFTLDRRDDGWFVVPNPAATNETLLNGRALASETPLAEGDVLAVGREARGIAKLPLTVRFTD